MSLLYRLCHVLLKRVKLFDQEVNLINLVRDDVDAVLTTRELAVMLKSRKIAFGVLPNDGVYDNPLGESTGGAMIFGATGGVLEAALRSALTLAGLPPPDINFKAVRGMEKIKECTIEGVGTVAAVNGIGAVQEFYRKDPDWYKKYVMVEVMACVGGCLGGGGEPKYSDPETLTKRMKGVYSIDERATIRSSHLNPDVQKLYKEHLEKPLSHVAEQYLHTNYYARNSTRQRLALFLDGVDRRDGHALAEMFEPNGCWDTNSPLGVVYKDQIADFVASLPKKETVYPKHQIVGPTGLNVIDAMGRHCSFEIDFGSSGKFQTIKRIPQ
jgi:NADH-quinone oxidoreductase subunit G